MKQTLITLLATLFVSQCFAQIAYESPHVKGGKTVKFILPKGYFEVIHGTYAGSSLYVQRENVDIEVDNLDEMGLGILSVMHVEVEDQTLASLVSSIKTEMIAENDNLVIIDEPKVSKVNGRDCFYAAMKGDVDGEMMNALYFQGIEFGDYFVMISYFAYDRTTTVMPYVDFKKIIATWSEEATEREDGMIEEEYDFEEEYETGYLNDFFETGITYYDILPDYGELWDEPMEDNSHLLAQFVYKNDNGNVKTFSGGSASNYPTNSEMAKAIQKVLELNAGISLKLDTEFANEDHSFKLYSITGGGTITSVYTTEVNGELVFFMVDGGSTPITDFKPAVRDFMLTMWIDFVDWEEEAEEYIDEE